MQWHNFWILFASLNSAFVRFLSLLHFSPKTVIKSTRKYKIPCVPIFFLRARYQHEQAHEQQQEQTIFSQFLHKVVADYIFHLPFVSFKEEAHKFLSSAFSRTLTIRAIAMNFNLRVQSSRTSKHVSSSGP